MTHKLKKMVDELALEYAISENDRRGFVKGHNGETKDAFKAGYLLATSHARKEVLDVLRSHSVVYAERVEKELKEMDEKFK